ncbi:hypothetical protein EMIT0P43_110053 [Pseudomonas jessenii]
MAAYERLAAVFMSNLNFACSLKAA